MGQLTRSFGENMVRLMSAHQRSGMYDVPGRGGTLKEHEGEKMQVPVPTDIEPQS